MPSIAVLPPQVHANFDDVALEALLRKDGVAVICIWSPHMPLSVEAVHEVAEIGKALNVAVVPVMDPRSDRRYARTVAAEAQLPKSALRPATSLRLLRADAFQHTPTIVVFADGQQQGSAITGFRARDEYERLIQLRLEGRR
jgi:hypothetical protein